MKTLGIIGGIAPESTIEYYRLIIASYRAQDPDGNYPPLIINSINLKKMVDLIVANKLADVTEYLSETSERKDRDSRRDSGRHRTASDSARRK